MAHESIAYSAAIDSWPIRARGIITNIVQRQFLLGKYGVYVFISSRRADGNDISEKCNPRIEATSMSGVYSNTPFESSDVEKETLQIDQCNTTFSGFRLGNENIGIEWIY